MRIGSANWRTRSATGEAAQVNEIAHSGELEVLMATYPDRAGATQYASGSARRRRPQRGANGRLV